MNDKTIDAKISISEDLGSRADGAIRDFWTTGRSVRQAGAVTGSGRILDGAVKSYETRAPPTATLRQTARASANAPGLFGRADLVMTACKRSDAFPMHSDP